MKVLYVTDPGADYLSDQIYDGLCSVLERQNVIDFPAKPLYHDQQPAPHLTQNPDYDSALHDVESMIRERRIDLTIVSSPRSGAMEAFRRLNESANGTPVVLLDGEDDSRIRSDAARCVGAGLYFKREYKKPTKVDRNGGWSPPATFHEDPRLEGRIYPLPFSVTASSLSHPSPMLTRDVDISFVGRASHRKRVRAVNLLRRTKGIRFEGGVYLDAADRRSKLAASWLGIATSKLMGDPPAPAWAQMSRMNVQDYRALLHRSKMALSVRGGGFDTVRYWEIVAAKTLLVSEPPDIVIPHNFEHGRHVIFCRHDFHDLPAIVRRLRDDDQVRQDMVEAAYRHLLAYHTSERRATYLLDLCRRML
jgi:hypothetical protein